MYDFVGNVREVSAIVAMYSYIVRSLTEYRGLQVGCPQERADRRWLSTIEGLGSRLLLACNAHWTTSLAPTNTPSFNYMRLRPTQF